MKLTIKILLITLTVIFIILIFITLNRDKIICKLEGGTACFSDLSDDSCQSLLEPGKSHYIWCNDIDNRGAILGNSYGPKTGEKCIDWIADHMKCPPINCKNINISRKSGEDFGWCNDPSIMAPLRGDQHGDYDGKCKNWIWNSKDCKNNCICTTTTDGTVPRKGKDCNTLVCGVINGEKKDCINKCKKLTTKSKQICGKTNGKIIKCPGEINDCMCVGNLGSP